MAASNGVATSTMQPADAQIRVTTGARKLSADEWQELSTDLWSGIQAALDSRSELEEELREWTQLYELEVQEQQDSPWVDAANLVLPTIPAELDAMLSYITAAVFIPRLYIVSGNTPQAGETAPATERYYNAELMRQRGEKTWYDEYLTAMHLALRDGLAGVEVLWSKKRKFENVVTFHPKMTADGQVAMDDDGEIIKERDITRIEKKTSEVSIKHFALKDFLWAPADAPSVEEAAAVYRVEWWYESDVRAKIAAVAEMDQEGYFDKDACERALGQVTSGATGASQDSQGSYDKDAGGELEIGQGQGAQTSKFFKNRGPIKIFRCHSRQYDMNRDDDCEENVFWVAGGTNEMIGWQPYEYVAEDRPQFVYAPFPRPGRINGYSLVKRLRDIAAEKSANRNQRANYIDMALQPPMMVKEGDEIRNKDKEWGLGVQYTVSDVAGSMALFKLPELEPASFQDSGELDQQIAKLTGQNAPSTGAQSSGRRSATEIKQAQSAQTTRANTIALRFRLFLRGVINFAHRLNIQYLDDDPTYQDGSNKFTLPRDVLAQDYQIDVAGASDPSDNSQRRTEILAFVGAVSKFPLMQSNIRQFTLLRQVCEAWQMLPDGIIGTEAEAKQADAAQQQAMQQQQQMAAQGQQPQKAPGK